MVAKKQTGRTGRPAIVPGEKPTKEKIFDAAVDLFADHGYDRTSVRDIARAVGIAESAVYRHYDSKEAILDAILSYMESQIYAPLPAAPDTDVRADRTIFRDMLEGLPHYIMANPKLVKIAHILFTEMYHSDRIRDYMRREYLDRGDATTEALFREQMDTGKIRHCDPVALAGLFNAYRFSWCYEAFIFEYGKPLDKRAMERELEAKIKLFEALLTPDKAIE